MENNFNLKKFLTENKLTPLSKQLNEQADKSVIKAFREARLSEQENLGPKIYNFKLTRRKYHNDVDIWKDHSLTIADLKDGNFKRVSLNLDYDFAELFEAGNEEGFLVIYSKGEGKRYDRDPSNWTEEQFLRLESVIDDVY